MDLYQPAVGSCVKPDAVEVTKRLLYKTRPCRFYEQGKCTRGERCTFAHGNYDAKACPDFSYTQMCRDFMDAGACPRGSRCKFAHSTLKLRPWGRARGADEPGNTAQAPQLPVLASVPIPCVTAPQTLGDRVECNPSLWPSVLKETETSVVSTEDELCESEQRIAELSKQLCEEALA